MLKNWPDSVVSVTPQILKTIFAALAVPPSIELVFYDDQG